VRGYNNTVNKYMSSDMEEKFISQNQFTDILATDTSQSKEEVHIVQSTTDTTVMEWNGYKKLPIH
jgi:hypothetical protein